MDKVVTQARKMREGECRKTRKGAKYCMRRGKVRFSKK